MAKLKQLYHHTLFYTFANMIEALAPLILIPYLTRTLTVYDYGLWTVFQSCVAVLVPLIGLGYKDAIRMYYLHLTQKEFGGLLTSATVIILSLTVCAVVMVWVSHDALEQWLHLPSAGLLAMIGAAAFYSFFYMAMATCQFAHERRVFIIVQSVQTGVSLLSTVAFIYSGFGWEGCVYGKLIGLAAACVVSAFFLATRFHWCRPLAISYAYIRTLAVFGAQYLPYGLLFVVVPLTNRLLIAHMSDMESVGLYALGESFSMALNLVIVGFMFAWQPWLFRKLAGHDADGMHSVRLSCTLFVVGLPLSGVVLTGMSYIAAPILLGPNFQGATAYVFAMMMAAAASGYVLLAHSFLHYHRRVGVMSLCALLAMVSNGVVSMWLIAEMGPVGAGWGAAICYMGAALLAAICARNTRSRVAIGSAS